MKDCYYVYVLKSLSSQRFYKGLTCDIDRRLSEHLSGRSKSTKNYLPLELVHVEVCCDRNEARKVEKYLKSGFGREIIRELAGNLVDV